MSNLTFHSVVSLLFQQRCRRFWAYLLWLLIYWFIFWGIGNAPDNFHDLAKTPSGILMLAPFAVVVAQAIRPTLFSWLLLFAPTIFWAGYMIVGLARYLSVAHPDDPSENESIDFAIFLIFLLAVAGASLVMALLRPKPSGTPKPNGLKLNDKGWREGTQ